MLQQKKNTAKNKKQMVKVTENGPYLVSGNIPLAEESIRIDAEDQCHGWKEGKKFPLEDNYALCRCGHSKNKPFCDGTHEKIKFNGKETATDEPFAKQARVFDGPDLKLADVESLCVRARFCHRAGGTWKLVHQSADPKAKQTAIEEACDCPSGRLVACEKNGQAIEPDFAPSISVTEDTQERKKGPLWVKGGITVKSADGRTYEKRNRVTLCRCGKSANKPFCDGKHLD
ncbi:MAG: CDGSH iron-sulfur domain-containing protein [Dehalococcoidales bacterium]|nr:CDGSH iron-sulfur domain-containing protein [Dehalococcoidales bacterium]